jgi:uncharacterized SAM-binding protein YcdF (DUF218 family)
MFETDSGAGGSHRICRLSKSLPPRRVRRDLCRHECRSQDRTQGGTAHADHASLLTEIGSGNLVPANANGIATLYGRHRHGRRELKFSPALDPESNRENYIMIYYVSKVLWIIAAPTSALILISASAALWAALGRSNGAAWLAAAAAWGLVIAAFTPLGIALTMPLEHRFMAFSPLYSQAPPDGIIVLAGSGYSGIDAVPALSRHYPNARIVFSGHSATALERFARFGGDPARVYVESRPRTTFEEALYSAALLKPKPGERWLLITLASHMPRAVGCFRTAGFQVEPYPVGFSTGPSLALALVVTGSTGLVYLDAAAKEWIGLTAYRLMGRTDALFPAP